jgi:hypothetical protein
VAAARPHRVSGGGILALRTSGVHADQVERAEPRVEQPVSWWLKHVDGLLEVSFDRALQGEGIDRGQWQVLNAVAGGASSAEQVEAAFARLEIPGVRPRDVLGRLVARGWLYHEGGKLSLTATGAGARRRLQTALAGQRERLTLGIDAERYRITVDTLRRMAANLSD